MVAGSTVHFHVYLVNHLHGEIPEVPNDEETESVIG